MKWPTQLTLIRHAPSSYNALKSAMQADGLYQQFLITYAQSSDESEIRAMAEALHRRYPVMTSDSATPLAEGAANQALLVGQTLRHQLELPEVIYVSPYVRTEMTLAALTQGWPELASVRTISEERIREQEFGLRILYADWRFFFSLHPEQRQLHDTTGSYWYRYPQGENVADVRQRNRSWMNTLTRDFAQRRVLAITHHITILAIRANMDRLDEHQFVALDKSDKPKNCSLTVYRGDPTQGTEGRFLLESYNQALI